MVVQRRKADQVPKVRTEEGPKYKVGGQYLWAVKFKVKGPERGGLIVQHVTREHSFTDKVLGEQVEKVEFWEVFPVAKGQGLSFADTYTAAYEDDSEDGQQSSGARVIKGWARFYQASAEEEDEDGVRTSCREAGFARGGRFSPDLMTEQRPDFWEEEPAAPHHLQIYWNAQDVPGRGLHDLTVWKTEPAAKAEPWT